MYKMPSRELTTHLRLVSQRLPRFGLKLSVLFQQNLNFSFRLFEFLAAVGRELDAFFKERQGLLQRNFTLFQLVNNFFQSLEALFKSGQRISLRLLLYCTGIVAVSRVL
jgi:hypothetical protein